MRFLTCATALALTCATAPLADVVVTFRDGAPKDRFTLVNTADCATEQMDLVIDLTPSPSGLIFDTTDAGAGVEVFQPFELVSAEGGLAGVSEVSDGDQMITLSLNAMAPGAEVMFTIDLDDTGGGREITVSGAEIAGAKVRVPMGDTAITAVFDETGLATLPIQNCTS